MKIEKIKEIIENLDIENPSKEDIEERLHTVEEDLDPDLEILRKKPKLKSHSERISESYKKEYSES